MADPQDPTAPGAPPATDADVSVGNDPNTDPAAASDTGQDSSQDDGDKPFYKSPVKVLGGLWLAKKLIGGSISRARTHRRREAVKELRTEQRQRKRLQRAAEARTAQLQDLLERRQELLQKQREQRRKQRDQRAKQRNQRAKKRAKRAKKRARGRK